ncbi:hypothetical protein HanIR_Chr08g0360331 [Helianthus annuus]|nr:hypothetical protein HanIR_Chr08g0360331 [Helianthus annuus]
MFSVLVLCFFFIEVIFKIMLMFSVTINLKSVCPVVQFKYIYWFSINVKHLSIFF